MTARQVVLAGLLLVAVGILMAQKPAGDGTLHAERFVVRDRDGRERGSLGVSPDGGVTLSLKDAGGRPRAGLVASPDGTTALLVANGSGDPQVRLTLRRDGEVRLVLAGTKGERRVAVEVSDARAEVAVRGPRRPGGASSGSWAALAVGPDGRARAGAGAR